MMHARCGGLLLVPVMASMAFSSGAQGQKPSVAVIPFDAMGLSSGEAMVVEDQVRKTYVELGDYEVVERGSMEWILSEQGFQQSGACRSDECSVRVGQLLGVGSIVTGSVGHVGKLWIVTLRKIDVQTGRIVKVAEEKTRGELEDVIFEAARKCVWKVEDYADASDAEAENSAAVDDAKESHAGGDTQLASQVGCGAGVAYAGFGCKVDVGIAADVFGVSGGLGFGVFNGEGSIALSASLSINALNRISVAYFSHDPNFFTYTVYAVDEVSLEFGRVFRFRGSPFQVEAGAGVLLSITKKHENPADKEINPIGHIGLDYRFGEKRR